MDPRDKARSKRKMKEGGEAQEQKKNRNRERERETTLHNVAIKIAARNIASEFYHRPGGTYKYLFAVIKFRRAVCCAKR